VRREGGRGKMRKGKKRRRWRRRAEGEVDTKEERWREG
jgi:hypothetical protein